MSTSPSRQNVGSMFDRIAHRYDLLNRLLSFGTDVRWRKRLSQHLPAGEQLQVLDLATGTADVLISLEKNCPRVLRGTGVDLSFGMLSRGLPKLRALGLAQRFRLLQGDAQRLPLPTAAYDAVTISFGIRNVLNVDAGLREMHRILKPGGRALILEFSLPGNPLFRAGYLFYFRHVLPRIGALLSGDGHAYRYLNQTVETFPYGQAFCSLMENAGFQSVRAHPLTFGIATLYQGDK
jgi:demethylmenaquinone methyltransferase/2-methoxy-6-polyprenyl-1,4-benzoquinol methylase